MQRIICLLILAASLSAQSFTVTSVTPARNSRGVSAASPVSITFNTAVDPLTVTPQNIRILGRHSGPVPGVLSVGGGGSTVTFQPTRPYFAGEWVTIYVSRFVTSATSTQLTGGHYSVFLVDSAAGSGNFQLDIVFNFRMPNEGLIRTYGFYAGDIDRDGSPDMTATNEVSYDIRLHKNNGAGSFPAGTIIPMPSGHEPSPNDGGDVNGDGWIDFVTGNQNGQSIAVFLNDGAGNYLAPVTYPASGQVHGLALLDADADGDLDVAAPNFSNVAIFLNNGNGTFASPTFVNGGGSGEWCVAVGDANNDGRPDLYSGNFASGTVGVLIGNGAGGFTLSTTVSTSGNPWSIDVGDFDGDGTSDVAVANNGASTLGILRGNGTGGLLPVVTYPVGSAPVWVDVGDIDGDDDIDVTVASFGAANARFYRNNGLGVFGNSTTHASQSAASTVVVLDYDRDGDSDVFVTDELEDKAFFYRQTGPSPASVQPPGAHAALRVNSQAMRAGFGGRPNFPVPGGETVFVNVSGGANLPFLLLAGVSVPIGVSSSAGFINLVVSPLPTILADGFSSDPAGFTNGFGEAWLAYPIPPGVLTGISLTLQALVLAPTHTAGASTTNPETVSFL